MLKRFTTKQLVFVALVGAALFVIDLLVSGISAATGVAGAGGLINAIFFVGLATIGGLVVKKFGSYTIMAFIYGVLAVPTLAFGPPGVHKIFLAILLGLIADTVILLFRYRQIGYYFSLTIANVLGLPVMLFAFVYLGLPGADALRQALWFLMGVYAVESVIGAWLGILLYNKKISKMGIVQQISD